MTSFILYDPIDGQVPQSRDLGQLFAVHAFADARCAGDDDIGEFPHGRARSTVCLPGLNDLVALSS